MNTEAADQVQELDLRRQAQIKNQIQVINRLHQVLDEARADRDSLQKRVWELEAQLGIGVENGA